MPFLLVMVAWLALLFASFSLFAPPNPIVIVTLLVSGAGRVQRDFPDPGT